jgi:hypothetical protein
MFYVHLIDLVITIAALVGLVYIVYQQHKLKKGTERELHDIPLGYAKLICPDDRREIGIKARKVKGQGDYYALLDIISRMEELPHDDLQALLDWHKERSESIRDQISNGQQRGV